mgnify:CR=1 FL=1
MVCGRFTEPCCGDDSLTYFDRPSLRCIRGGPGHDTGRAPVLHLMHPMSHRADAARRVPALHSVAGDRLGLAMDPYRVALFLLAVLTFSRIHQHFGFIAAFRPALLLVVFATGSAVLNPKSLNASSLLHTWYGRLIVGMGVFACISTPFGISLGAAALFIITDYSKTLVFACLVLVAMRGVRDLYTFAWAYVIATGVLVWMAIFLFRLSSAGSKTARLGNLYSWDANDLGVVLLVGLGFTLLTFQTSRRFGRIVSGVVLLGIGVTIARTGSRGALLGLVAAGIALLVMLKSVPLAKRVGFVAATATALVLFAPHGYWEQMKTIVSPTDDYNWSSTDGRKQIALRGLGYMLSYPVFGLGINNFGKAECFESEKALNHVYGTGIRCTAPHNSYVQAGAELGIPGLVLWMLLVFGGIRGMLVLRRRLPAAWSRGTMEERFLSLAPMYLAVSMVGFAVSSAFVSFAWLDPVYYLTAMMGGVWVVVSKQLPNQPQRPVGRVNSRPVARPQTHTLLQYRNM